MFSTSLNLLKLSHIMTPTPMFLFALLGFFLVFPAAHADDFPEISLHNDSTLDELSVVRNWTLICEHLCSLNISGPACGPDCASSSERPVSENRGNSAPEYMEEYNFSTEHQAELCETLCDNGLGGTRCICPIRILPAASAMPSSSEGNRICSDFCRYQHVTLRGCKRCSNDKFSQKPLKNSVWYGPKPPPPPPPSFSSPFQPHRFDAEVEPPFGKLESSADGSIQVPPATPITPDWNRLCATLCRQGTGGILCNCDLAPF